MIKINYIEEYILLAETLNFSKTAELYFITQPALSKHIAILEDEMEAKLFERNTRSVKLTPAGEAVYNCFRTMMKLYSRAHREARALALETSGNLVIDSPYYWTGDYTEPLLSVFREKYPACSVSVRYCQPLEGMEDLKQEKCDILISMEMPDVPSTIAGKVFEKEELCLFLPKNHLVAQKSFVCPSDLNENPYVYLQGYEKRVYTLLDGFEKKGIFPSEMYCCEQVDMVGYVLRQKNGLSILPCGVRHMNRTYIAMRSFKEQLYTNMLVYYRKDTKNNMVENFLGIL